MLQNQKIAFFGAGPMGEAMIAGVTNSNIIPTNHIYVQNRSNHKRLLELKNKFNINILDENSINFSELDIIVLAMQPGNVDEFLEAFKLKISSNQLIISVITSVTTNYIDERLNAKQQVIRVMPNTSSMVGESATAMSVGKFVPTEVVEDAKTLLRSIGEVYIIPEDKMDIFTGIAGSGPAYFYYLMEQMEQAGIEGGLSENVIRNVVAQTIFGAAKMVLSTQESPSILRDNVAAPNGPTAAGLSALENCGGGEAMIEAVKATTRRSIEMNQETTKQKLVDVQ